MKDNELKKAIGKRIKQLRTEKGYTQQQFSEIIDTSPTYLSDLERGVSFPGVDKLVAIINALECSADELFADVLKSGYKVKSSQLTDMIEQLSPKERERAFAILQAFIDGAN